MRQWTDSSLVQVVACCLFCDKPLLEPMMIFIWIVLDTIHCILHIWTTKQLWLCPQMAPHFTAQIKGSLGLHGANLGPTAWISNYIHYKVWNEITYPFWNSNGCTVDVLEWITKFHPTLYRACDHLSMLGFKTQSVLVKGPLVCPYISGYWSD